MYILIPGRHHLLTTFQFDYLNQIINNQCENIVDIEGNLVNKAPVEGIIFAVTSSNHSNTRRNPLPFYLRAIAINDFAEELNIPSYIYGIDDIGHIEDFASYTLKKIKHESEGRFNLNPDNTLVLCSTPVLEMYEKHGFKILPAELQDKKTYSCKTNNPWDLIEKISSTENWHQADFIKEIHPASINLFNHYSLDTKIKLLFSDRIIGDDGDITSTRDYNSYVRQMDQIAELKYNETSSYIQPGRIGDIGCAVGSWIKLASSDSRYRESDFYGIEVARHLYDICLQRKHNNEFANPFIFFAQKNAITGLVFDQESMNTIHTSSLTHEIESYAGRESLLKFINNRYSELKQGGIWINRDVIGPEDKNKMVLLKLNKTDGQNDDTYKNFDDRDDLAKYLSTLSTYGRFLRFAKDFRAHEGYQTDYEIIKINEEEYIHLKLSDACEFLSKKDYIDNWKSEMHETFCFWSYSDWQNELNKAGFILNKESKAYANPWIIENRYKNKATLYEMTDNKPKMINYPVTNALLISQKV